MLPAGAGRGIEDAVARLRAGEPRAALAEARRVLAERDGLPPAGGRDDAAAVACLVVIARCHQALGDHPAARAALERAQAAARTANADGPLAPLAAVEVEAAIATQDRIEGRYHDAHRRLRHTIAEAARAAGDDSVVVAHLRNELGICCKHLARFEEAETVYNQALITLQRHLGADHPELAGIWHNLAGLAHARGDHRRAAALGRHGLEIRLAALGERHLHVAADRAALAPILDALDRREEAEHLLRQALAVFEQCLGADHHEVAVTLQNLAAIHHRNGDFDAAATAYRRSLDIRSRALGDSHPELATTLVNIAVLDRARGHDDTARHALRRAIGLLEPAVPADHPLLVAAHRELDQLTDSARSVRAEGS